MKEDIKVILQQISDVLLMNGGFLDNPGLYTGDMGLVLFFARYSRYTKNDLYLEYSFELMEKLQARIHSGTPVNYKQGLTGIGSAIEYLVQNGFFEADTDDILEDIDQRVFFSYQHSSLSINEIRDIGYYAVWRLSGNSSKKELIRQSVFPQIDIPELCNMIIPDSFAEKSYNRCLELISKQIFFGNDMGTENGLAGWGMSLLTELDGDDSWFSLFPNDIK